MNVNVWVNYGKKSKIAQFWDLIDHNVTFSETTLSHNLHGILDQTMKPMNPTSNLKLRGRRGGGR